MFRAVSHGTKTDLTFYLCERLAVLALAPNFLDEATRRYFMIVPQVRYCSKKRTFSRFSVLDYVCFCSLNIEPIFV